MRRKAEAWAIRFIILVQAATLALLLHLLLR
jgi:hypothetical protein